MDCSLPGFSVYGISQARVLEWFPGKNTGDASWKFSTCGLFHIIFSFSYLICRHILGPQLRCKFCEGSKFLTWSLVGSWLAVSANTLSLEASCLFPASSTMFCGSPAASASCWPGDPDSGQRWDLISVLLYIFFPGMLIRFNSTVQGVLFHWCFWRRC